MNAINEMRVKHIKFIFLAIMGAFKATLCCLPALLFVLFGTSFSLLSLLEPLGEYRTFFTMLSLISFSISIFYIFFNQNTCTLQSRRKRWYVVYVLLALLLLILFLYPEILGELYV